MTLFAEQFIHVLLNWKCWLVPYKDQSICILHPYESICHVGDKITSMKLQNVSHYAHMVAMCFWNIWWLHNFIIKNRLWILKRSIWRTIFGFLERKQNKATTNIVLTIHAKSKETFYNKCIHDRMLFRFSLTDYYISVAISNSMFISVRFKYIVTIVCYLDTKHMYFRIVSFFPFLSIYFIQKYGTRWCYTMISFILLNYSKYWKQWTMANILQSI